MNDEHAISPLNANPIPARAAATDGHLRDRLAEWEARLGERAGAGDTPEPEPEPEPVARGRLMLERIVDRLPAEFKAARLTDLPASPSGDAARAWALDPKGRNCVHVGDVGIGKTYAAAAQARSVAWRHGVQVLWLPARKMFDGLRPDGGLQMRTLTHAGLLVIDDIATVNLTPWEHAQLGAIIDERWNEHRPIVATTNLAPSRSKPDEPRSLAEVLDPMIWSRLMLGREGAPSSVIRWVGPDRRRPGWLEASTGVKDQPASLVPQASDEKS